MIGTKTAPGVEPQLITVNEFANLARVSRRTIDRMRAKRPSGFPVEYDIGIGSGKNARRPRFKLDDVTRWLEARPLW